MEIEDNISKFTIDTIKKYIIKIISKLEICITDDKF